MLVLSRKVNEKIVIDGGIVLTVVKIEGGQVRLGIEAPSHVKIYREEKVNPMGGCLPIMVQIPVFIALYWVLLSSVEMRGAPWVGWIHDLSAPDPFFILPVVMTLTTMLQTALNPAPPDPMQAKMMWIMPLAFSVMFFFFPSGLVLYWITNNVLSIAQQWLINKRMGVPPQFNLPKFR